VKLREFGTCDEVSGAQYALALYTLAEGVRAHDILEIGAGWGWSTRAFALSLENRVNTRLVSVDMFPKRIYAANRAAVKRTGVPWQVIEGDSARVTVDGEFDLIYIDGDPYLAHADFLRFYPRLRENGLIILDGYGYQVGPTEAVESLQAQYPFVALPYDHPSSHAVHRKLPTIGVGDYTILCESCSMTTPYRFWRDADVAALKHSKRCSHRVYVNANPRNVLYIVIPKGNP
jgi:hypothetical protein